MNAEQLFQHVKSSIILGDKGHSKLPAELLYPHLSGLSSNKVRHFFNNLCHIPNCRHLEIGVSTGSTLIAAGYRNPLKFITAIDNWSMQYKDEIILKERLEWFKEYLPQINFLNGDCWSPDFKGLGKFDTYFYDAFHSQEAQMKAITEYWGSLKDQAVIVIDDFDARKVNRGTWKGIDRLKVRNQIVEHWHLKGGNSETRHDLWWGGLGIFVIDKTRRK